MIDKLIKFYDTDMSFKNLIFERYDPYVRVMTISMIINLIFPVALIMYYIKPVLFALIISIIYGYLFSKILQWFYIKIIKKADRKYVLSSLSWDKNAFDTMILERLQSYLNDHINSNKLEVLAGILKERIDRKKNPILIFFSSFVAFFLIFWETGFVKVLGALEGNNALILGYVFCIVNLFLSYLAWLIYDTVISFRTQKLIHLFDLVSELRLKD